MIFLCWNKLVSLTYSLTIVLSDVLHSHNASLFICLELIYSQRQQCFWLSHLFWSCLEMFPLWLMCWFSLRSFNLYNYGGSWYLAQIWLKSKHCLEKQDGSSTPLTILKIVIADLLRRCLLSHHCFQEHWIACIPEGDV